MSSRPPSNAGFTMVELLVAMTLGLLLTIVIGQVFVTSKESYRTTEDLSRLQENARFAVSQMSRVIRMASFISNPNGDRAAIFLGSPALFGTDSGTTAPDDLTVRYQGSGSVVADNTVFDCHGNEVGAVDPLVFHAVARYYLAPGADGANALFCDNTGSVGVAINPTLELASGVENMQILYGEDTTGDGTADRYVKPSAALFDFNRVVAVRIALLVRSSNEVASGVDTKTYDLAGTVFDPVNDRRLRRVYTTTITLRNRAP